MMTLAGGCQTEVEPDQTPVPIPEESPAVDDAAAPNDVPETTEKVLRIGVTDDTSAWREGTSGVPNMEVWIRGTGSWFPDTSFGGDVLEEAGPFPVGERSEFFIYPLGRDAPEFRVPVLVSEEVIAGSVRDMISITVEDNRVTVAGTSIPDFEVTFDY